MTKEKWQRDAVIDLFQSPLIELVHQAQTVHQKYFSPRKVQVNQLYSIKTGLCPEDCAYCPQSGHYKTRIVKEADFDVTDMIAKAKLAQAAGVTRFCVGAAWRSPPKKDFPVILAAIKELKKMGMETCATVGMLTDEQAQQLKEAGLDFYNHNLDTSPEFYNKIITTRTYEDRLATIQRVVDAGIEVCCGGIFSMGESRADRIELLWQLYILPAQPKSITINRLARVTGTPLENSPDIDPFEYIRFIASARILFPQSYIRLSAGRSLMSDELQAMCFLAGMNSIFYGERLFQTANPECDADEELLKKLGLEKMTAEEVFHHTACKEENHELT